jgi:hypothetical protein
VHPELFGILCLPDLLLVEMDNSAEALSYMDQAVDSMPGYSLARFNQILF